MGFLGWLLVLLVFSGLAIAVAVIAFLRRRSR